jgi:hypothetical protein
MSCDLRVPTRTLVPQLACLLLAILVAPLHAQTSRDAHPYYDVSQETAISGTVSAVITRPSQGMLMGSHLILSTASGSVDASLGRWGLQGKDAVSIAPGRQVEVTGVMKRIGGREVFLARTIRVEDKVYTIRNIFGIPLSPLARERATKKDQNGDSL